MASKIEECSIDPSHVRLAALAYDSFGLTTGLHEAADAMAYPLSGACITSGLYLLYPT